MEKITISNLYLIVRSLYCRFVDEKRPGILPSGLVEVFYPSRLLLIQFHRTLSRKHWPPVLRLVSDFVYIWQRQITIYEGKKRKWRLIIITIIISVLSGKRRIVTQKPRGRDVCGSVRVYVLAGGNTAKLYNINYGVSTGIAV